MVNKGYQLEVLEEPHQLLEFEILEGGKTTQEVLQTQGDQEKQKEHFH